MDNNPLTGDRSGNDYIFSISWNNTNKTWVKALQETSKTKHMRLLDYDSNFTNFYSEHDNQILLNKIKPDYLNCCYIHFEIDLETLNYPKNYALTFTIEDKSELSYDKKKISRDELNKTLYLNNTKYRFNLLEFDKLQFVDSSPSISIPVDKFELLSNESQLNLGSNENLTLYLKSNSNHPVKIILNPKNDTIYPFTNLTINPTSIILQPHDIGRFTLSYDFIDVNARVGHYFIPLKMEIYLPDYDFLRIPHYDFPPTYTNLISYKISLTEPPDNFEQINIKIQPFLGIINIVYLVASILIIGRTIYEIKH